jgi:hypothetical protein
VLGENSNVAALGVDEIETICSAIEFDVVLLSKDEEVMAVEVNRVVSCVDAVKRVDDKYDPLRSSRRRLVMNELEQPSCFFLFSRKNLRQFRRRSPQPRK